MGLKLLHVATYYSNSFSSHTVQCDVVFDVSILSERFIRVFDISIISECSIRVFDTKRFNRVCTKCTFY